MRTCDLASRTCVCRRPNPGTLLPNPGFDRGLEGWGGVTPNVEPVWSPDDADGCPGSGSIHGENSDGAPFICVRVTPGTNYFLGAKFKGVSPSYSNLSDCQTSFYSDFSCTQVIEQRGPRLAPPEVSSSLWTEASTSGTAPAGANSIFIHCYMWKSNMDQIYLTAGANTF
jgi:hypothetical protein